MKIRNMETIFGKFLNNNMKRETIDILKAHLKQKPRLAAVVIPQRLTLHLACQRCPLFELVLGEFLRISSNELEKNMEMNNTFRVDLNQASLPIVY